jgi:hypothetical protein
VKAARTPFWNLLEGASGGIRYDVKHMDGRFIYESKTAPFMYTARQRIWHGMPEEDDAEARIEEFWCSHRYEEPIEIDDDPEVKDGLCVCPVCVLKVNYREAGYAKELEDLDLTVPLESHGRKRRSSVTRVAPEPEAESMEQLDLHFKELKRMRDEGIVGDSEYQRMFSSLFKQKFKRDLD